MLLIDVANDLDDYVPSPDALDSDFSGIFCKVQTQEILRRKPTMPVSPNITDNAL